MGFPGFGDPATWPPGTVQREDTDIDAELLCSVADTITTRWLGDPDMVSEYSTCLSDAEYAAIARAVAAMDGHEVLCRYRIALRRVMHEDAMREAIEEIERERRESEDEAAVERMQA